jgi:hypothetical protein
MPREESAASIDSTGWIVAIVSAEAPPGNETLVAGHHRRRGRTLKTLLDEGHLSEELNFTPNLTGRSPRRFVSLAAEPCAALWPHVAIIG